MQIYKDIIDIDNGTTRGLYVRPNGTKSVSFKNQSNCFVLVNVGANSIPSTKSFDFEIEPYSELIISTSAKHYGVAAVTSVPGLQVPSSTTAGKLTFVAYDEPQETRTIQLVGAPTSIASTYPDDAFPYTKIGASRLATGFYTQFDATGYAWLRMYVQNFSTDYVARINIQVTTTENPSLINEQYNYVIGRNRAKTIVIPLRRFSTLTGDTISVLPQLFINAANAQNVTLTPVLSQSGLFVPDSAIEDVGAYDIVYSQKAPTAAAQVVLAGPIWVYGLKIQAAGKGLATFYSSLGIWNNPPAAERIRLCTAIAYTNAGATDLNGEYGIVPFSSAYFVGANECIGLISTGVAPNHDIWIYHSY